MRWAIDACGGSLWLDVNQANPRAVAFYEKHTGFAIEAAERQPRRAAADLAHATGDRAAG